MAAAFSLQTKNNNKIANHTLDNLVVFILIASLPSIGIFGEL